MLSAQDVINKAKRLDTLCRNVFSTGEGKELLELLKENHVYGKLYQESDRATVYAIAQRDFVLELEDKVKSTIEEQGIPGGEEIS